MSNVFRILGIVFVSIVMVSLTVATFAIFAPVMYKTTDSLNSTVYDLGTSTAISHWNTSRGILNAIYGPIAAILIIAFIILAYIGASQKDYYSYRRL